MENDNDNVRREKQFVFTSDQQKDIERKKMLTNSDSKKATHIPHVQSATQTNYHYNCSHHLCNSATCGVDKKFIPLLRNCTLFQTSEKTVSLKMFMQIQRGADVVPIIFSPGTVNTGSSRRADHTSNKEISNKKQSTATELVTIKLSLKKFVEEGVNIFIKLFPHAWNVKNDSFHRKLGMENFGQNKLQIMIDFSANLPLQGQDGVNSQHPAQALQDVAIALFNSRRRVDGSVFHTNHHWSFWGDKLRKKRPQVGSKSSADTETEESDSYILIDNNAAFQCACIEDMITYYQAHWREDEDLRSHSLDYLEIYSDGCGDQNKSRTVARWLSDICDRYKFLSILWTYAPTAAFKCNCDACGADSKAFYRRCEASGAYDHAYNAYMVYKLMQNMPNPKPNNSMMNISKRFHKYVYCAEQVSDLSIDEADPKVIKINNAQFYEDNDGNPFQGMMSQFQMRSEKQYDDTKRIIYFRQVHCHCSPCKRHEWDACEQRHLPAANWVEHDVAKKAKEVNKVTQDTFAFYSALSLGKWNPDGLMVVALQLDGHDDLVLATLQSQPFRNENRTGKKSVETNNRITVLKILKHEYIVTVKMLVKKIGCSKPNTYEYENYDITFNVPLSCIYIDWLVVNSSINYTNLTYINAEYDRSDQRTIVIRNYRAWTHLL
jgi:hypothetical protein